MLITIKAKRICLFYSPDLKSKSKIFLIRELEQHDGEVSLIIFISCLQGPVFFGSCDSIYEL